MEKVILSKKTRIQSLLPIPQTFPTLLKSQQKREQQLVATTQQHTKQEILNKTTHKTEHTLHTHLASWRWTRSCQLPTLTLADFSRDP